MLGAGSRVTAGIGERVIRGTMADQPERDRLSNEDFLTIQQQLTIFGGAVMVLDLEGFIARCQHAEAVAPLIDPTAFMKGHEKLEALKDLAEGALKFKLASLAFQNTMNRLNATKGSGT